MAAHDAELDAIAIETAGQVADLGANKHVLTHDGIELFVEGSDVWKSDPQQVAQGAPLEL